MMWQASCFNHSMLQSCHLTSLYGPKETMHSAISCTKSIVCRFKKCLHELAFRSLKDKSSSCLRRACMSSGFRIIYLVYIFSLCLTNSLVEAWNVWGLLQCGDPMCFKRNNSKVLLPEYAETWKINLCWHVDVLSTDA